MFYRLGTPPRFYNQIIRKVAQKRGNTPAANARLFALVNVAMADAGILAWDQKYIHDYVSQVRQGRDELMRFLTDSGVKFWTSHANFVLARFADRKDPFVAAMRARGILVRDRSRDPGCEGCVRITVGTTDQTSQLLGVLQEVLTEIGIAEQQRVAP